VGDCDGGGSVSVAELITGVNIALGLRDISACTGFDVNGDSMVQVNELIRGVRSALDGCEAVETPTEVFTETPTGAAPTETPGTPVGTATTAIPPTETPTGAATVSATVPPEVTATPVGTATTAIPPTETPTPTSTAEAATATQTPLIDTVAGGSVVVSNALGGIANVIAAAVTGVTGGSGGGAVLSGATDVDFCELGGMVETIGGLPSDTTLTLTDCAVSRPGGSAVFNGTIALANVQIMSIVPPRLSASATFTATIAFKDESDATTLTTKAALSTDDLVLTAAAAAGETCTFNLPVVGDSRIVGLELTLAGTIESSTAAGTAELEFDATKAEFAINQYGSDCVPSDYVLKLDGAATASQSVGAVVSGGGDPLTFALEFVDFTLAAQREGDVTRYQIDGSVAAECFGGSVSLQTLQGLELVLGEFCPTSGQLAVEGVGVVTYADGAVSVDDLDPATDPREFASCLDPALLICSS
jgi:hypothetical protein